MLIGRREKYEPGTGEHRLWLSVGGSAGHSGLWAIDVKEGAHNPETPRRWDVAVSTPGDAREKVKVEKKQNPLAAVQERALEVIRKHPGGLTQTAIARAISASGTRVREALIGLEANGVVRRIAGKRGSVLIQTMEK
jgi:uncharacterized membrane protein